MGGCASSPKIYKNVEWSHKWATSINTGRDLKEAIILFSGINPPGRDSFWKQSKYMKLVCVTCSEVISQQAEDPFCEDAGSEKVVPVVIHRKPGLRLRGTRHTLWIQRSKLLTVSQRKYVGGFKISLQNSKHHPQHLWTCYILTLEGGETFSIMTAVLMESLTLTGLDQIVRPTQKNLLEFRKGWQMQAHRLKKADMRHKRFQLVEIVH